VGDTLLLDTGPDGAIELRCGPIQLTHGRMGRIGHHIGVRLDAPLSSAARKSVMRFT